jgi:hypothetical protein
VGQDEVFGFFNKQFAFGWNLFVALELREEDGITGGAIQPDDIGPDFEAMR